ncbi:hypothetical protein [Neobacillus rhizophilus]|uniref:Uncharacterized protein n=1 Tax=Neobacillus rhizophilus TaxID=2833579 RepID=A0A942U8E3_9BACI|nr:hypothetical protein [Neobacillus rhizophilus]MBS4214301.1 hypothetical protein [Neobacillus rhizophilus]
MFAKLTTLILLFSLLTPVSNGVAAGDVTPPKLTSLVLSGTSATQGESITLSAEILEEESGVDVAYAYYDGPTGYSKTVSLRFNPEPVTTRNLSISYRHYTSRDWHSF